MVLLRVRASWIGSKLSRKLAKSDSLERACKSKIWSSLSLLDGAFVDILVSTALLRITRIKVVPWDLKRAQLRPANVLRGYHLNDVLGAGERG